MLKINKKILLCFLCGIFIFSVIFVCLPAGSVLAGKLEVSYPTSQTGITLTDTNTPIPIFLKYIFDMGMFLGLAAAVYSLGASGIYYLMSPAKPEYRSIAKDRVTGAISGILILAMTYLILTTLNPQLKFFQLGDLQDIPPIAVNKSPGVYFYKSSDCSGDEKYFTSNINDFGTALSNQINSVLVVQGKDASYISTLYSSPGLFGRCQDASPNKTTCQNSTPPGTLTPNFASSVSIHRYDFNPNSNPDNDGVYFYRKSFYNPEGGWLKIDKTQIKSNTQGFFGSKLEDLIFQDVPIEDQICDKWDDKGICTNKKNPTLAGKEISSIKIAGNYIVYFLYFAPTDNANGPWSYCQEFPTPDDVNREGPLQFKWEKTPNQKYLPNRLYIYPVKEK